MSDRRLAERASVPWIDAAALFVQLPEQLKP